MKSLFGNYQPEIDHISLAGFKSVKNLDHFEIRPINILIGANGVGKSNFVSIFSFLHEIREGRLQEYVRRAGGAEQILYFGSKTTDEITFKISFRKEVNSYNLTLTPTSDDTLVPTREVASYWDKNRYNSPFNSPLWPEENGREAGISSSKLKRTDDWVRERLGRWRVYHLHDSSATSPMRKTAQVADNRFLRDDAANLPAFLYLLKQKYQTSYSLIRATIRQVAPFFDDFNLEPDRLNSETIRLSWKHRNSDQYFGASALSDGTLRFMALAALFLQPPELRPAAIILDEPELGLHPKAIALLSSLIKQASIGSQVILSTQSPVLLDHFNPEDVVVAERQKGETVFRRLESGPLESWLTDYGLGQLWEKNELGGRPQ
jgi:predicted ATPase